MSRALGVVAGSVACAFASAFALGIAACIFPPKVGDGTGGGGGGGGSGHGSSGGEGGAAEGGSADAAAMGKACDVPTTAGIALCEEVSTCPTIMVNQNTFMGCGFVIVGKAFSLACECSGYVCPAPPTPTCAAAALILEQQTAAEICAQLDNGGCSQEFLPPGVVADSGHGPATCDPSCTSECAGESSCLAGCGC